jgi:large subunit ribosomal protein L18
MPKLSLFARRRQRVRSKLRAQVAGRPRLSVHRTGRHIYAQVIDDTKGATLASASTLDKDVKAKNGSTTEAAADVGKRVAAAAKKAGISSVVFDADAAREGGLEF